MMSKGGKIDYVMLITQLTNLFHSVFFCLNPFIEYVKICDECCAAKFVIIKKGKFIRECKVLMMEM